MEKVIAVKNLRKQYRKEVVVEDGFIQSRSEFGYTCIIFNKIKELRVKMLIE